MPATHHERIMSISWCVPITGSVMIGQDTILHVCFVGVGAMVVTECNAAMG